MSSRGGAGTGLAGGGSLAAALGSHRLLERPGQPSRGPPIPSSVTLGCSREGVEAGCMFSQ